MTWRERVGALRVDTTPLRESRDFRLLFWAGTVFYLGGMVSQRHLPLDELWAYDERTDEHATRERELRAQQSA